MQHAPFDLLLRGGTVIDGTGMPRFTADVGTRDGVIRLVGSDDEAKAKVTIDVTGLIVAPGFIDSHAHDDLAVLSSPGMIPKISQGVTTVVNGNCGNSLAPYRRDAVPPLPLRPVAPAFQFDSFGAYLERLENNPAAVNVASLIGHTSLRVKHVRTLDAPATAAEIQAMRDAVLRALQAGALGLSSGTFYPPAAAAPAHEIVAVGADLAAYGGVYATHLRDEGDHVLAALDEAADIAKALGVALVVSHHKVMGAANFGRTRETLERLTLLAQAQKVCLDCYPYTASSSLLRLERLTLCDEIIVTSSRALPEVAGSSLASLAQQWQCSRREALERVMPGTGMYFMMDEGDVRRVLTYPETMVGSDGIPADAYPHPRLWGTFPRVLGHYSREQRLFPLETAVHKMTGLTAAAFGLAGRGELREGFAADITVFDAQRVGDRATYLSPTLASAGIVHVIVNGQPVWTAGAPTGALPGQCVRRLSGSGQP